MNEKIGLWVRRDLVLYSDGRREDTYMLCGNEYFDERDTISSLTAKTSVNPMITLNSWQAHRLLGPLELRPGEKVEI